MASPVQRALAQVQILQQAVIDNQRFHGFSGPARCCGGFVALVAAAILAAPPLADRPELHVIGWGCVFALAVLINQGAMLHWFWNDPRVGRDWRRLRPVAELLPSIAVGGVLTMALLRAGQTQLLFGMWMVVFALTNLASRRVLPRSMAWVGLFYFLVGAVLLALPQLVFTNPWPMGLTFCAGELAGGLILHLDRTRHLADPTPLGAR